MKLQSKLFAAALGIATLAPLSPLAQISREARPALTWDDARDRSARVSEVRYSVRLRLDESAPEFGGDVTTNFVLAGDGISDLTIDFVGGTVASVAVNGRRIETRYNGFFVILPGNVLQAGENVVEIAFSHPYSNDGSGLYRFEDPEDGRHYLYTDFEPFNQNALFPSFDQPDLKARYATEVTVPADWQVISIVAESSVVGRGDERVWTFPESLPVSTYIYALHAGDYHQWDSNAGAIPLRLFARESLASYVHPEDWFGPTRQGFEFYQAYFEMPYTFGKYDQIIVPHFNAGAMENVGAVTFSERYLSRGAVTKQQRRSIASVILHEMAHMWFGDTVTMDWWNGLWLNESFATFMATLSMVEATEFTDEWQSSYRRTARAYDADERDTTHPIELPIPDTDAAFANFDAITYNKGSAVLTQLHHLVGPETFRRGIARYLALHRLGNTTIDDFLGAVSAAAGEDLGPWADAWLNTPGTNQVAVNTICRDGNLVSAVIEQTAPASWPVLRRHRTQLGLYRFTEDGVDIETLPATYAGELTRIDAPDGIFCPDAVYANHGDWDFVRVRLDADTLAKLSDNLNAFDDPLTRAMLWQSVYDQVLVAALAPEDFISIALENIGAEPVDETTAQVLGSIGGALSYSTRLENDSDGRRALGSAVEQFLFDQFLVSDGGSDRQYLYFDRYVGTAASTPARERLARILDSDFELPAGFALDQDRRWAILARLGGFADPRVAEWVEAERARDPSDEGRLTALSVAAAAPEAASQRRFAETLLGADLPVADARAIAAGLFPDHQQAQQIPIALDVLSRLGAINDAVDPLYYDAIAGGLLGALCDRGYLDALEAAISQGADLHPSLRKALLDMRFDVRRCLAIGAMD
jgi:aminopeptidase N